MSSITTVQKTTYVIAAVALLAILKWGLLAALISGLLVYYLVEFGSRRLKRVGIIPATGKVLLLVLVVLSLVSLISLAIISLLSQLAHGPESLVALLQKMADVVDSARTHLPLWLQAYLPGSLDEWQTATSQWLRENASYFSVFGKKAGVTFVHIIVGMVIGGIVALDDTPASGAPLASALSDRMECLSRAFSRIVFSQLRISALNTALTAIFLLIVLPAIGSPLPLANTMVVITFIVGMLPILGNLISNTIIFLVALSVSPLTAIMALSYLIIIHKLEYFINARIIGARINAHSWEILSVMLVMEACFGMPGLIAAPIYYAYLKDELIALRLV